MDSSWLAFVPALVAFIVIVWTRKAALSLLIAVIVGVLILEGGNPLAASEALFVEHLLPALEGPWHIGPIIFTLTLGSFAQVLERSGGFQTLLSKAMHRQHEGSQRRGLLSVYGLGLLCFFDGLANAILVGRVARPVTDSLRISRQLLAYLIDSTSSAVACVAFVSTWIATQLSLIEDGIKGSDLSEGAVELFLRSIPANPYCWLVLWMVLLVILNRWWIGPMKRYQMEATEQQQSDSIIVKGAPMYTVLVPMASLLVTIPGCIYLWQDGDAWTWRNAFSSSYVPHAMVAGASISLLIACVCFPKQRRGELTQHINEGAGAILPALVILVLAWALGTVFKQLEVAQLISGSLNKYANAQWLPLFVFIIGAVTSFLTGSSWGTMGILMPLAIPVAMDLNAGASELELLSLLPMVIGAVFGGAVFGDNCSPFSDTTVVTSLSSGCSTDSHVMTQLPYAMIVAVATAIAYFLMGLGMQPLYATLVMAAALAAVVLISKRND